MIQRNGRFIEDADDTWNAAGGQTKKDVKFKFLHFDAQRTHRECALVNVQKIPIDICLKDIVYLS